MSSEYDTRSAVNLGGTSNNGTLYRAPDGEHFLASSSGAITPLSRQEARHWAEQNLTPHQVKRAFAGMDTTKHDAPLEQVTDQVSQGGSDDEKSAEHIAQDILRAADAEPTPKPRKDEYGGAKKTESDLAEENVRIIQEAVAAESRGR